MKSRYIFNSDEELALAVLRDETLLAITDMESADYLRRKKEFCGITMATIPGRPLWGGMLTRKDSCMKEILDSEILRYTENNLIDAWKRKHMPLDQCHVTQTEIAESLARESLNFEDLRGTVYLFIAGCLLALVVVLAECLTKVFRRHFRMCKLWRR